MQIQLDGNSTVMHTTPWTIWRFSTELLQKHTHTPQTSFRRNNGDSNLTGNDGPVCFEYFAISQTIWHWKNKVWRIWNSIYSISISIYLLELQTFEAAVTEDEHNRIANSAGELKAIAKTRSKQSTETIWMIVDAGEADRLQAHNRIYWTGRINTNG